MIYGKLNRLIGNYYNFIFIPNKIKVLDLMKIVLRNYLTKGVIIIFAQAEALILKIIVTVIGVINNTKCITLKYWKSI